MNITSFREMPKGEQFQALAEILSQVATYRVVENSIEKKGMDVVFTYVVPDFDDDELMEFKRELDVMGFTTEIEEIDNELNLLVYPYKGIPGEAFEYLDEWTNPEDFDNWDEEGNMTKDYDDEEWTDPAGGTHDGNEEDPAHQYESLDDSKYIIDSLFEDEDDEGDLKFPDDFAKDDEEIPDDFGEEVGDEDEVEVVDGEAIEKLPGEGDEIDDLFGDNMEDNDDFISDEEPLPVTGDDDLIHNDLFGDEEMPTDDGEFGELEPEPLMPDTDDTNIDVKVDVDVDTEEAKMVKSQLINIKKSVDELLASIKPGQDMEPWVQAKLTLAQDYLQTVKNRLLDVDDEMNESLGDDEYDETHDIHTITFNEACEEIREEFGENPTLGQMAEFIIRNWEEITGTYESQMHEEQEFPDEVMELLEEFNLDYDDFSQEFQTWLG